MPALKIQLNKAMNTQSTNKCFEYFNSKNGDYSIQKTVTNFCNQN